MCRLSLPVDSGPAFAANHTIDTMANRDVYSLLCHLMDIPPAANNGSLDTLQPHLTK
jgi:hypothetical protein